MTVQYDVTFESVVGAESQYAEHSPNPLCFHDDCREGHGWRGPAQCIARRRYGVVYVVDGDLAMQRSLAGVLQVAGYHVKLFGSVREFLDDVHVLVAGCVLVDIGAFGAESLDDAREITARHLGLAVVAAGPCHGDVGLVVSAMKAGVADYLESPFTTTALLTAVSSSLASLENAVQRDRAAQEARIRVATLTGREREVLDGLLAGGTNKTIAKALGISPRTVEIHRAHVMDRLGARTLPELVLKGAAGLAAGPNPRFERMG